MLGILPHGLTALLYGALAVHFWRTRWLATTPNEVDFAPWERVALLVPLAMQSWLLYHELFLTPEFRFGFGQALAVTLWLAVLIYWFESLFVNLEGMQAFVLPLAAVSALMPALFPGLDLPPYARTTAFRVHLTLAMLAYSLFTIAALQALLMALLERRLHAPRNSRFPGRRDGNTYPPDRAVPSAGLLSGPLSSLPPLLTLERLLFRLLTLGFVLLTLTLLTGVIFSEELFQRAFRMNHKTLFAVLSWVIFGMLLGGRYAYGWRGRRALRWTLAGFVALLFAYVGSRFVLEVILERSLA